MAADKREAPRLARMIGGLVGAALCVVAPSVRADAVAVVCHQVGRETSSGGFFEANERDRRSESTYIIDADESTFDGAPARVDDKYIISISTVGYDLTAPVYLYVLNRYSLTLKIILQKPHLNQSQEDLDRAFNVRLSLHTADTPSKRQEYVNQMMVMYSGVIDETYHYQCRLHERGV